jgi:hypothetical protein
MATNAVRQELTSPPRRYSRREDDGMQRDRPAGAAVDATVGLVVRREVDDRHAP